MTEATSPTAPVVAMPALPSEAEIGTTIRDKIDAMSPPQIEERRNEILNLARVRGGYEKLEDFELHELACIARKLRRTSIGPPKEPKAPRVKATAKSIDDLM